MLLDERRLGDRIDALVWHNPSIVVSHDDVQGTYLSAAAPIADEALLLEVGWGAVLDVGIVSRLFGATIGGPRDHALRQRVLRLLGGDFGSKEDVAIAAFIMCHVQPPPSAGGPSAPPACSPDALRRFPVYEWVTEALARCPVLGIPMCDCPIDHGLEKLLPPPVSGGFTQGTLSRITADRHEMRIIAREVARIVLDVQSGWGHHDAASLTTHFLRLAAWIRSRWIECKVKVGGGDAASFIDNRVSATINIPGANSASAATQRTNQKSRRKKEATRHVLVPLVEKLNHCADGYCCPEVHFGKHVVLRATAPLAPGQQVFINYGAHTNEQFLALYGFVPVNNPFEVVSIDLESIPDLWDVPAAVPATAAAAYDALSKSEQHAVALVPLHVLQLQATISIFSDAFPTSLIFTLAVLLEQLSPAYRLSLSDLASLPSLPVWEPLHFDHLSATGAAREQVSGASSSSTGAAVHGSGAEKTEKTDDDDDGDVARGEVEGFCCAFFGAEGDDRYSSEVSQANWLRENPQRASAGRLALATILRKHYVEFPQGFAAELRASAAANCAPPHLGFWVQQWCAERSNMVECFLTRAERGPLLQAGGM